MKFDDQQLRRLNAKNPDDMVKLVQLLCDQEVSPKGSDKDLLSRILQNTRRLNHEQVNEILLVLNQDRMSEHFFRFFFSPRQRRNSRVSPAQFVKGIQKFGRFAMLCYGNFRFAYKKFNSMTPNEFRDKIKKYCRLKPMEVKRTYKQRPKKTIGIRPIQRGNTWFVGYLSGSKIARDNITFRAILLKLGRVTEKGTYKRIEADLWDERSKELNVEHPADILQKYGQAAWRQEKRNVARQASQLHAEVVKVAKSRRLNAKKWEPYLKPILARLTSLRRELQKTLERAKQNTDVYLSWDYMDVYAATSMREKWEYEATYDFLQDLFKKQKNLRVPNVRYFDPTQSYSPNRIDKGLVESLMLKRAECTLYLAQETDTLGKDSELASTLAQGKPVIAYVPEISDVDRYSKIIAHQPLAFLWKRWLLLEAEEIFTDPACLDELEATFKHRLRRKFPNANKSLLDWKDELFAELRKCLSVRTFNLIEEEEKELKSSLGKNLAVMCEILAVAEKHYFNKRALTVQSRHPLAVQVDLASGVANGVLLVRNSENCAKLIRALLTRNLSLRLVHEKGITELREKTSNCPYRVVTDDPKLTNSFWNFYLTNE